MEEKLMKHINDQLAFQKNLGFDLREDPSL